ncbi:MAG TPA: PP2C family serine/threonine-protein phosphatase [Pseudonocardia sp.]
MVAAPTAAWRLLGGSVTGSLHRRQGRGCDDAFGWHVDDAVVVAATADGAGSRPGTSAFGAFTAVRAVLAAAVERPEPPDVAQLFQAALSAVEDAAHELGVAPDLLATTLSVVVIAGARVAVSQVGDGIVVHGAGDAVEAVAVGARPEHVNETVFLTTPGALPQHLRTFSTSADAVDALALTTDGLRYQVLDDLAANRPFAPFFHAAWEYARRSDASAEAVTTFLDEVEDQSGDDKTLVLAVRDPSGTAPATTWLSARPPVCVPS